MASLLSISKEFSIPLPGGHIAAKSWGIEGGTQILALHGWQDNLGTFDRLFPLLPNDFYIVAFDYLGHGLSSHKPPGTFYNFMEMVIEIQRVVDYLKWNRFNLIGHSLGGKLALMYSSIFPDSIISLICLDSLMPATRLQEELSLLSKYAVQMMLRMETKLSNPVPEYSYEEARERLMNATMDILMKEGADALLQRGTRPSESGNGVVFTRDIRVREMEGLQIFSNETMTAYLSNLKSHLLVIVGEDSRVPFSRYPEIIKDIVAMYRTNCESFEIVKVQGGHFFHLNNPEDIVASVTAFFRKFNRLTCNL